MTMVSIAGHVSAVRDHLVGRGVNVEVGVPPAEYGWVGPPGQSPFVPYAILWRIGSKDARNLSIDDDAGTEGRLLVFVRCFGGTVGEAEGLVDDVRAAMLDQSLTVPARRVVGVTLDNGQTTTKSEDVEVAMFEAGDFYRIRTVPEE